MPRSRRCTGASTESRPGAALKRPEAGARLAPASGNTRRKAQLPSIAHDFGPTMPSTVRPKSVWNVLTAFLVLAPKTSAGGRPDKGAGLRADTSSEFAGAAPALAERHRARRARIASAIARSPVWLFGPPAQWLGSASDARAGSFDLNCRGSWPRQVPP